MRLLSPRRGLANQAPDLTAFQVLRINMKPELLFPHRLMMVSVRICLGITGRNSRCGPRSLTHGADVLPRTLSQLASRCAGSRDFPVLLSLDVGQNPTADASSVVSLSLFF